MPIYNTGYVPFSAFSALAGGTNGAWANHANALVNSTTYAEATLSGSTTVGTNRMLLRNPSIAIPNGAVVTGIIVRIRLRASASSRIRDQNIRLSMGNGTNMFGNNKARGSTTYWPTGATTITYGGSTDTWGLTAAQLETVTNFTGTYFGINITVTSASTTSTAARVEYAEVIVYYDWTNDEAPVFTIAPTITFPAGTRYGPNTPATLSFRATDDISTGTNALTWELRSTPNDLSTTYQSGTCTSGVTTTVSNITSLPYGTSNLNVYLWVRDAAGNRVISSPISVPRDNTQPAAPANMLILPNDPVGPSKAWQLQFSVNDTGSLSANELTYTLRTAPGTGGTLLSSGNFSSQTLTTTPLVEDTDLVMGNNARYLRVTDGGLNVRDTAFTVDYVPDTTPPTLPIAVTVQPVTDLGDLLYAINFRASDNQGGTITHEVYTAAGGTGELLYTGTSTSGVTHTTDPFIDTWLGQGANTRYLRLTDQYNNTSEFTFTVTQTYAVAVLQGAMTESDGFWSNADSTLNQTSANAYLGGFFSSATGTLGQYVRYRDFPVNQGATITSAYLRGISQNFAATNALVTVNSKITFADEDDALRPETYTDAVTRPRTTAVSWHDIETMSGEQRYHSPNVASSLMEVINRSGYAKDNGVVVFIEDDGSTLLTYRTRRVHSVTSNGIGIELVVTYVPIQTYDEEGAAYTSPVYLGGDVGVVMDQPSVVDLSVVADSEFSLTQQEALGEQVIRNMIHGMDTAIFQHSVDILTLTATIFSGITHSMQEVGNPVEVPVYQESEFDLQLVEMDDVLSIVVEIDGIFGSIWSDESPETIVAIVNGPAWVEIQESGYPYELFAIVTDGDEEKTTVEFGDYAIVVLVSGFDFDLGDADTGFLLMLSTVQGDDTLDVEHTESYEIAADLDADDNMTWTDDLLVQEAWIELLSVEQTDSQETEPVVITVTQNGIENESWYELAEALLEYMDSGSFESFEMVETNPYLMDFSLSGIDMPAFTDTFGTVDIIVRLDGLDRIPLRLYLRFDDLVVQQVQPYSGDVMLDVTYQTQVMQPELYRGIVLREQPYDTQVTQFLPYSGDVEIVR